MALEMRIATIDIEPMVHTSCQTQASSDFSHLHPKPSVESDETHGFDMSSPLSLSVSS